MSNIINPKPRFGYNPSTDTLYDYVAQRDLAPTDANYSAIDGMWDLAKVKAAILEGQTIESGHVSLKTPSPPATGTTPNPPKTKPQAGSTLVGEPVPAGAPEPASSTAAVNKVNASTSGLTAEEITAIGLSPLQEAALGIRAGSSVTAAQVKSWGLTEARADALKLSSEQKAVLMS